MLRLSYRFCLFLLLTATAPPYIFAQQSSAPATAPQPAKIPLTTYTWQQVLDKFQASNPTLRAGQIGIDESRAQEITAHLRPNPGVGLATDGTQIAPYNGAWQPLRGTQYQASLSYLHERDHKRELRLQSAKNATDIAISTQSDLERTLVYDLRVAFVQTLQAKAVRKLTKENLDYYDHELSISRDRYKAGDIAQVDLDRLEIGRVQYESDLEVAEVNLRTEKIQLLQLLNDRTPVDQFDVTGPFDYTDALQPLSQYRQIALDTRPDLRAAYQAVEKAQTDHKLAVSNGSTDPTFGASYTYNPSFNNPNDNQAPGLGVEIPLRIFDRNQGEKQRTLLDITHQQKLVDAAQAQVFSDVDSAYATLDGQLKLLRPYKATYLQQALRVRDTISFSYQHGGASLLDFLDAQQEYRGVQLGYLNLVGAYLTATSQLNLAVGREVIQ